MSFTLQLGNWANKTKKEADKTVRTISMDLFASVIMGTPVDTGRARGNWATTIKTPATGESGILDKSGGPTIDLANKVVAAAGAGNVVHMVNNLPYIQRLEYGWSKLQAPAGMVRINFQRVVVKYGAKSA